MNKIALIYEANWQRLMAVLMAILLLVASLPVQQVRAAQPVAAPGPAAVKQSIAKKSAAPKIKRPNLARLTKPTNRQLAFSANPSDLELFNARVFSEPLVPMDDKVVPAENQALAKALLAFKNNKNPEDISDLTEFLSAHPNSRWRSVLEMNIGQEQFETGYLTGALKYWESAWQAARLQKERQRKAVADQAVSNLVLLEARLGLMDSLEKHLSEIGKRVLTGSVEMRVKAGRDGLWAMKNHPEVSFKCGPYAVNALAKLNSPTKPIGCSRTIKEAPSTTRGTNLAQLEEWAQKIGLNLQMAKRSPGSKIIVPAVVHFKVGHFAAITAEDKGRYRIQDPTFGSNDSRWLSLQAIESETDGYFLVPKAQLPANWQEISRQEAEGVWGKGIAETRDGGFGGGTTGCGCGGPGGSSGSGGGASGGSAGLPGVASGGPSPGSGGPPPPPMATASAYSMNASLTIVDYPLQDHPPIGPDTSISTTYNYGEGNQPATFTFSNLGQNWSLNWVSYLTVDASQNITVRVPGGGYEVYEYQSSGPPYLNNLMSQALIVNLGGGSYQRQLPDGSTENYTLSDGTNIYMTSIADPQGNAATISYDDNYRVTSITDAASNPATTFAYVSDTIGDTGFYNVASITDGFGRSASFTYDSTVTYLTAITDAAGNVSQFLYTDGGSFINMMTTPYGSTTFYQYTPQGGNPDFPAVGLKVTYPDGTSSVIENWIANYPVSYFWDREATSNYPTDPANLNYSHCRSERFLLENESMESAVPIWVRPALEAPVVYSYAGESAEDFAGPSNKPTQVARQLSGFRETATIAGSVSEGEVVGISIGDDLLPSEGLNVFYTVQSGDTTADACAGIAAAINNNSVLQSFGMTATSDSNVVTITSWSTNVTSFSAAYGNSVSLSFASSNPAQPVTLSGSVTAGDVLTITVSDAGLGGGEEAVNYTVQSNDTFATIVQALSIAINSDTNLQNIGVNATWTTAYFNGTGASPYTQPVLSIQSNSVNSTTYASSTSGGASETITLDDFGYPGNVQAWNYERNALGHITQAIDPVGRTFSYTYADNNIDLLEARETRETYYTDNYLVDQWEYNDDSAPHRPTLHIDSSAQQTQMTYNGLAELATVTDANGNTSTLSYNDYGYLTQIQGPLAGTQDITTFTFYPYGPVQTVTDSEGYTLSYSYDNLNRLTNVTYPDGTSEQTIYDRLDAVAHSDRLGRQSRAGYDRLDQLVFEIDPLGRKTKYSWCVCGSLATLTDPANNVTTWEHDLEGRIVQKTYADGSTVDYAYEPSTSRLTSKTDALSQVTNYAYNLDNTIEQTSYSDAVNATSPVTIAYDTQFPRTTSISNGWGQYNYSYNSYPTATTLPAIPTYASSIISLSGMPSTGDYVNFTFNNSALAGGKYNLQYQVQSGDTNLATLASSIKTAANSNSTLTTAGISTTDSTSSGILLTVAGTGATTVTPNTNGVVTETLGGSINSGDVVSITVYDLGIYYYNQETFSHTVSGGDTLSGIASNLASQITTALSGIGITASSSGDAVIITSASVNPTTYSSQVSSGAVITIAQSGGPTESADGTGGGRLASITNSVIANSPITFSYDALGRTLTRMINGSNNATAWSYDAISRVTSETNPLGTFSYAYVDDNVTPITIGGTASGSRTETITVAGHTATYVTSGSDTLSSIASALSVQINSLALTGVSATATGPVIAVSAPTSTTFSDTTEGAITISTGASYSLGCPRLASIGYPNSQTTNFSWLPNIADQRLQQIANLNSSSETISQFNYAYDAAGEIKQWQQQQNSGNTHLGLGYDPASQLSSAVSDSGSSFQVYISGTASAAETVSVTAYDASLTGTTPVGQETASYSASADDSASTIASNLASAINTDMSNIDVTASASGSVITITTSPDYATSFSCSRSGNGETIQIGTNSANSSTVYVGGTPRTGDTVSVTAYNTALSGGQATASYTVAMGNTTADIASNLASSINTALGQIGVSASASGSVITMTTYGTSFAVSPAETSETIGIGGVTDTSSTAYINGTPTTGDIVSVTAYNSALTATIPVGQETATYTVTSGNTLSDIASGLASNINTLMSSNINISASASGDQITITNYPASTFTGATSSGSESITLGYPSSTSIPATIGGTPNPGDTVSVTAYNTSLTATSPVGQETASYTIMMGDTTANIATNLAADINSTMSNIGVSASATGSVITITNYPATSFSSSVSGTTGTITSVNSANSSTVYINGTPTVGVTVSVTAFNQSLTDTSPVGQETASYTVMMGDTNSDIASNLATAIGTAMSNIGITATASGNAIAISSTPTQGTTFSGAAPGNSEIISLSSSSPVADLHTQLYYSYDLASNRIGVQGDSTGSFPDGLTTTATQYAYNNVNELTATAAGGPIRFQGTTANPVKSAVVNVTETATIGGTITAGDVVTVTVTDNGLMSPENVNYTVMSGDSTTSVCTALKDAINGDSTLSGIGVSATSSGAVLTISSSSVNATLYSQSVSVGATETITLGGSVGAAATVSPSDAFSGNPSLASGANTASVTAVSGGGTATTDTFPVTISSVSPQSLTYDLNGNMTSDGTNSYAWDAENRLIQITYPGSGNNSQFTYDPIGRCVKIVETSGGSVTSTKQFVGGEERDASGSLANGKQFFGLGQINFASGTPTSYFYTVDDPGNTREVTDSSGNVKTVYQYDPYGQVTQTFISGSVVADVQYGGLYYHGPSGMLLTATRAYNSALGRFISRDIMGEKFGNRYAYCVNNPISYTDPLGLRPLTPDEKKFVTDNFGSCIDPNSINLNSWDKNGLSLPFGQLFLNNSDFSGGSVNLKNPQAANDFAHELFHQLQANGSMLAQGPLSGIQSYITEGIRSQIEQQIPVLNPYNYSRAWSNPFTFETQAQAFGDQVSGQKPNPFGAFLQSMVNTLCNCPNKK